MNSSDFKSRSTLTTIALAAMMIAADAFAALPTAHNASGISFGTNQIEIISGTNQIAVFTYKPQSYQEGPLIVVFHGRSRNAQDYRDYAIALADRVNAVVAAPLFDQERFAIHEYTLGGVIRNEELQSREEWLFASVETVVETLRRIERKPELDYYLVGHSAGGQMVMRLAAMQPLKAKRIVAANPGSHLFPRRDWDYGYGFGGLPAELGNDAALRRYLAQPLTIYLGTADILTDQDNLDRSESAMHQGKHRLERGRNCFEFAELLAQTRGWRFNWRKVETLDVGHDGKGMFAAPEIEDALFETKK